MEIVIIRKNKAVLDAEICPWSKVDGHSLLSNRVEIIKENRVQSKPQLILIWGIPVNITPKAGDFVLMPECMTHGVLPWTAKDRQRRIMMLRYRPQHKTGGIPVTDEVVERLEPEVRELLEVAHFTHVKEIAKPGRAAA